MIAMKADMNFKQSFYGFMRLRWWALVRTLYQRFQQDQLALTAGSLTFTTSIALVPFFAVVLAVFTAFPTFAKLQVTLQAWLVESLIPDHIARQVMGYLTQFSKQASKLGGFGFAALMGSALALIVTIDHTLNSIWRVKRTRSWSQKVVIYWTVMTLGPLLLGASVALGSYLLSASQGLVSGVPGGVRWLLSLTQFALLAAAVAALYRGVPNCRVSWSHACAGGLFVATGLEVAKKLLAWYLGAVPTYSVLYGAFATVPIFLIWIFTVWLIVLVGALLAAVLPGWLEGRESVNLGPNR